VTDSVLGKVEPLESTNIYLRFSPGAQFLCQTWTTNSRDCCAAPKDKRMVVREKEDAIYLEPSKLGIISYLDQWTEGCFEH
jgi:hypothetical protein